MNTILAEPITFILCDIAVSTIQANYNKAKFHDSAKFCTQFCRNTKCIYVIPQNLLLFHSINQLPVLRSSRNLRYVCVFGEKKAISSLPHSFPYATQQFRYRYKYPDNKRSVSESRVQIGVDYPSHPTTLPKEGKVKGQVRW